MHIIFGFYKFKQFKNINILNKKLKKLVDLYDIKGTIIISSEEKKLALWWLEAPILYAAMVLLCKNFFWIAYANSLSANFIFRFSKFQKFSMLTICFTKWIFFNWMFFIKLLLWKKNSVISFLKFQILSPLKF